MSMPFAFAQVGRLCAAGDNVAMAVSRLESGTAIELGDVRFTLEHTVLEGHRFAVRPIGAGEPLLSWGRPFGHALTAIEPGDYVCNAAILAALAVHGGAVALPARPNFADHAAAFNLDAATVHPAPPVARVPAAEVRTFDGYRRAGRRGVGTRNVVVVLGTTSRTAGLARRLAEQLQPVARLYPQIDGIAAIAHTEGGGTSEPHNATEILRALAGFIVHPNVGAVLALDLGVEPITNARLRAFLQEHDYPLDEVPHAFLTASAGTAAALAEGERLIRGWLPEVAGAIRTPEPLSELRVALQCGGSDAFSGVSGNPLAGQVVHEVVRQGGTGVLCETDELAGAEAYLLDNIRDLDTARALLARIERARQRMAWHGVTFESNPSAGNQLRGLYNITLKSLGAGHKKDPRTRIDHVIDYAEPLPAPGFCFMDSPGNDLEAIAGEVAAGCNLILFITGNGSITNFPFVPTLKITTTTRRHRWLETEMDFNAGRYLDGEAMDALATEALELVVATASGQRTRGEQAGHSQCSLWREWRQTDDSKLPELSRRPVPDGQPLIPAASSAPRGVSLPPLQLFKAEGGGATERVGLVLPTSLCSAQIARMAAERMNARGLAAAGGFSRFVALPHTEGCGFGGDGVAERLAHAFRGYATHPNVAAALLLEHGCEKLSNDRMRRQFEQDGLPLGRFGWASVQLDGGIEKALAKVEAWFTQGRDQAPHPVRHTVGFGALTLGLLSAPPVTATGAATMADVVRRALAAGASVLLPDSDPLLVHDVFRDSVLGTAPLRATLAPGDPVMSRGLHLVATESEHWAENLAALGASGAHVLLGLVGHHPQSGHPLLPVLQIAESRLLPPVLHAEVDLLIGQGSSEDAAAVLERVVAVAQGDLACAAATLGWVDFQLTRGSLGVSA